MILRTSAMGPILLSAVVLACTSTAVAHMYGQHVVELDSSNFQKEVVETASTWVVKFYAPWCGHCKSSAPAFSKAAKKLNGVAKIGVVNCDDHKDVCAKYSVQGFPTIKVFKGEGKKARRPDDYSGERSAAAIVAHVKHVMYSFVIRVKTSGIDAFLRDERNLPHVLLFSDKTSTSPLLKGLSAEFRNLASFGEVRKAETGELLKKYDVQSFPTVLAFKQGSEDGSDFVAHTGGMDPTSLRTFLKEITDGVTPETAGEPRREKVFRQPKALKAEVSKISSRQDYVDQCGARKDGRMCGLAFLPQGMSHPIASELSSIAEKYQYDNLAFAVIDTSADDAGAAFASMFGMADPAKAGFVTVRARKNKFAVHDVEVDLSTDSVTTFLDRLLGGDARFKKLDGELPEWPEEITEEHNADGKTEESQEDSGKCGVEPPSDGGSCGDSPDAPKIDL